MLNVLMLSVAAPKVPALTWALCQGILKGEVSLYCWPPVWLVWNQLYDNCFYLQNRLIQTSETGGQWYGDTSPFSIPWLCIWGDAVLTTLSCFPRIKLMRYGWYSNYESAFAKKFKTKFVFSIIYSLKLKARLFLWFHDF